MTLSVARGGDIGPTATARCPTQSVRPSTLSSRLRRGDRAPIQVPRLQVRRHSERFEWLAFAERRRSRETHSPRLPPPQSCRADSPLHPPIPPGQAKLLRVPSVTASMMHGALERSRRPQAELNGPTSLDRSTIDRK